MTLNSAFIPEHNIALFLDVDGTLLEIAPRPSDVNVPVDLLTTLNLVAARADGALALISGRSIEQLDQLFFPHVFPAAGQHGLERRDARGHMIRPDVDTAPLRSIRNVLADLQHQHPGLLLEDKRTSLAMHYRLAPQYEPMINQLMSELMASIADKFVLRAGKCVLEIAPAGFSKRTAIEQFMNEVPFAGKVPVFIGDDLTDEDGFNAVNACGGYSIRVGAPEKSAAKYYFSNVSAVLAWLHELNPEQQSST